MRSGAKCCFETSVVNYQPKPRNIREKRGLQLHRRDLWIVKQATDSATTSRQLNDIVYSAATCRQLNDIVHIVSVF
jgi:hypothetical protein